MKITILTQSEPYFLAENIDYLIKKLPDHSSIVSTVVFDTSPFGKRETFKKKALRTLNVFGFRFFVYYSIKFITNRINPNKSVKSILKKHNIPIIYLDETINHPSSIELINKYQPDLLLSIAGNQIFKKPLLELAPKGCLNLHTALLPKYRGLMPSFWVLKNDEKVTGVSVFFVDAGIDSGPILVQKQLPIQDGISQADLIKESKKLGMIAIIEAIELINTGNYELLPNPDEEKTYFSFPTREDVIDFYKAGKKFY